TEDHRRKLSNVLPFVLGATDADQLIARRRLQDLEREIKALRDEYQVRQSTIQRLFEELATYFVRAKELGIIEEGVVPQTNWRVDDYAGALSNAISSAREGRLLVPEVGATDTAVRELVRLTVEEEGVSR